MGQSPGHRVAVSRRDCRYTHQRWQYRNRTPRACRQRNRAARISGEGPLARFQRSGLRMDHSGRGCSARECLHPKSGMRYMYSGRDESGLGGLARSSLILAKPHGLGSRVSSCVPSTCTKPGPICRGSSRPPPRGEPFIIARAGKPVVKVIALDTPDAGPDRRLGFLAGRIQVPDDFDRMGAAEIQAVFAGGD